MLIMLIGQLRSESHTFYSNQIQNYQANVYICKQIFVYVC